MNVPSEQDIARAQALGRLAGRVQRPVEINPYGRDERVLRARWARASAGTPAAQAPLGGGDDHA